MGNSFFDLDLSSEELSILNLIGIFIYYLNIAYLTLTSVAIGQSRARFHTTHKQKRCFKKLPLVRDNIQQQE